MATDKTKVSTTIKNFVLTSKDCLPITRECGFDRYTDPEVIAETLKNTMPESEFRVLLDNSFKYKTDQRQLAQQLFGV